MTTPSPLHPHFDSTDASFMPYGDQVQIVAQIAVVELEYAAIRKAVGLMDCPHRGLLRLTGKDRLDFLHRMTTQDCNAMKPGDVRRAFLLNSKGRIMADLLVVHAESQTLIDLDVHNAGSTAAELDKMLFSEEVKIENLTQSRHRVSLHGPKSPEALAWWQQQNPHAPVVAFRHDEVGEIGTHLWTTPELAAAWSNYAEALNTQFRGRFIGWLAFNMARIEAGQPLFNIDFGPDSLPHETGPSLMKQAVSYTKGCYRGQEIVARMENLGHPAKVLVGFVAEGAALPIAGVPVYETAEVTSAVVGAVTSSAPAPMKSQAPVGFAMVKWAKHAAGTRLFAPAEGGNVPITLGELRTYNRATAHPPTEDRP
jgi:folate-binding protein YgfZ